MGVGCEVRRVGEELESDGWVAGGKCAAGGGCGGESKGRVRGGE